MASQMPLPFKLSLFLVYLLISNVIEVAVGEDLSTPKAYARKYWQEHVTASLSIPDKLMEKASPLTSAQVEEFGKIVDDPRELSQRLPEFCAKANLMCYLNEADYQRVKFSKNSDVYHYSSNGFSEKVWGVAKSGSFFREAMLKPGTLITIPDLTNKYPTRSFLPRTLVSKIPFSSQKLSEIKNIFHAGEYLNTMFEQAFGFCEVEAFGGERKQCVASMEDMIDFVTFVLGKNVVASTMDNTAGLNSKVLLGNIKGINGGKSTNVVFCHEQLYPYMLYYCHSIPNTRVYEVDIMDPKTKFKINQLIAICHEDTSSFSPDHPAFALLGTTPGKAEMCHFASQNDVFWVNAN